MSRAADAFDRLTGCESLAYTASKERLRERLAERDAAMWKPVDLTLADGRRVVVRVKVSDEQLGEYIERPDQLPAEVDGMAETERLPGESAMAWRNRVEMATRSVRVAAVERLLALRAELEHAQTDGRAIAWLKERGLLIETMGGQWVLKPRGEG